MATAVETDEQPKKGPSLVVQLGLLVGLTVLAAGLGWLTGGRLSPAAPSHVAASAHAPAAEHAPAEGGHGEGEGEEGADAPQTAPNVIDLEPMTTNLAAPTSIWVRLEVSLVFDGQADKEIARKIHQDLFAFMRTVRLEQISSGSGFQHLKTDLEERARLRSDGHVKDVLIRALIFE